MYYAIVDRFRLHQIRFKSMSACQPVGKSSSGRSCSQWLRSCNITPVPSWSSLRSVHYPHHWCSNVF